MVIKAIKTHKIVAENSERSSRPASNNNLTDILDQYITDFSEKSILVITSKIVSLCEGRVVKIGDKDKDELIQQEAQYYLPRESNPYRVSLTVTRNNLVATAGIDESNGNGYYILWPKDPQKTANDVREFLCEKFGIKHAGVIISDSKTTPFRWGVTAISLAHSGFAAVKDYIGSDDLFGRKFEYEKLNMADSLATAAVVEMGEGAEQTPLAIISDIFSVEFQDRNPTPKELESMKIDINSDLYTPLLTSVKWKKGKGE